MSKSKVSVCFVTNELYPLGPGGIGRMLYNFAKHNEDIGFPADLHFLIPRSLIEANADGWNLLQSAFENIATIHVCPNLSSSPVPIAQLLAKAEAYPWTGEWLFADSYRYYLGLLAAEQARGGPFDIIEFPDFGGWAVASIEAKRAGLAFSNSLISARVHSTQGVLYGVERFAYDPGHWAGIMFDAERHLFANADLIVGHDPEIMKYTAKHYGLEERWEGRSILEFPPIFVNVTPSAYERADRIVLAHDEEDSIDFIFSSRLQPVKRPDIFIRAAILFLENFVAYKGVFRLVCAGWDSSFVSALKSLVPEGFSDRILFIERASKEERQYYIDKSIVVVPSDYESLCLFAFEAAIAGRKVILNGACPAFGNGFRWRNGENCLLFDGSVESLTEALHEALSWRPRSVVEVAPDQPYWLGDASLRVKSPASSGECASDIAVVCYGIESSGEFFRHFDLACQIEDELKGTDVKYDIFFQLPGGSFSPESPEAEIVREKGWEVVFSSGNRECPEMFGRRLKKLGKSLIFLFPFGFEANRSFISSAIRMFREDSSLAIVSGHIELVDPHSGRSDYLRSYAGEAPSTALLSSRVAPALCAMRSDVLSRVPFDALAGSLWFEVFARTCALRGERIAIMPTLAGTLDPFARRRLETTKRISAGLLDQMGLAAGWKARLLSIDPVQIPAESDGRPISYNGGKLRQIFRINPRGRAHSWEPVGWQSDANGALVHPLDGEITVGEISGPYRRVSSITAHVRNDDDSNDGAEVAIGLARYELGVEQIMRAIEGDDLVEGIVVSDWVNLERSTSVDINLSCYGVSKGGDKILLISRPVKNSSGENSKIVFLSIDLHFNSLSIG
ncbi:glycosyltransferase [Sphingomonas sp. MMSM20]|uniref:glycosyltransferase n=1 Tax=Sphingomonas lycopersici TaxID=2951807 RepID=UPI0022371D74|nr:glycosyltransferase [Sphingomonas lycopersici]MCW6531252.1 glycosyltransferase [Sphingomonas lycopersici]